MWHPPCWVRLVGHPGVGGDNTFPSPIMPQLHAAHSGKVPIPHGSAKSATLGGGSELTGEFAWSENRVEFLHDQECLTSGEFEATLRRQPRKWCAPRLRRRNEISGK